MIALFAVRSLLSPNISHVNKVFVVVSLIVLMSAALFLQQKGMQMISTVATIVGDGIQQSHNTDGKHVQAVTWNIAAVNNNPFEYWITNEDSNYNRIMSKVSAYIDSPGELDVPVHEVFTDVMFEELAASMTAANWTGVAETKILWSSQYRDRKIISGFIKDAELGKKRLASMPDRVTNTINTVNEGVVMRPSVINCYNSGDLGDLNKWWAQWRTFIFEREVTIKKHGVETAVRIKDMITKIKRSKYPSITPEEEAISIPLQTLCAAIFDSILVSMMNTIDASSWQPLREDICNKLNRKKAERTMEILEKSYGNVDIQFLQEVASSFADAAKDKQLSTLFDIYFPSTMDSDRDQNSFILLKKEKFTDTLEVTLEVLKELNTTKQVPIADGDLLVLKATHIDGTKYLLASFHGDTNGLATVPVVTAVHKYALTNSDHKLLFGLDANTYDTPQPDQLGMVAFAEFFTEKKLNSCYGQKPNPKNFTTFHARTHLQPQLNKAVKLEEKDIKGDKNPKDFILFNNEDFIVLETLKDNTGERSYVENMVFPTLTFPSDHGVTSTVLLENRRNRNRKLRQSIRKSESQSRSQHDQEHEHASSILTRFSRKDAVGAADMPRNSLRNLANRA